MKLVQNYGFLFSYSTKMSFCMDFFCAEPPETDVLPGSGLNFVKFAAAAGLFSSPSSADEAFCNCFDVIKAQFGSVDRGFIRSGRTGREINVFLSPVS